MAEHPEHFILQNATGANVDIYFPVDGQQTTTRQAAQWSCTNADANNVNFPITQWHVDAFSMDKFDFAPLGRIAAVPRIQNTIRSEIVFDILISKNPVQKAAFLILLFA
jgi:hypothetical protein